jgi:WS/DGAT/MGAT family acyltransferase
MRREFGSSRRRSPFDSPLGGRREVAFASADLRAVHDAAKRTDGATLNDAVLATVTGALGAWVRRHHGSLGELRVKVPVSLHHLGDDPGNRDSFFVVSVPLDERDPLARLRATHAATAERKHEHDAEEMDALLKRLARTSPALERLCDRLERGGRSFAVNVSNVPGPRAALSVLGAPVREVYSIAEIAEHHALRVAVVSAAGRLHFGLCADPTAVDGLATIAADIEAEAAALVRAAGGG